MPGWNPAEMRFLIVIKQHKEFITDNMGISADIMDILNLRSHPLMVSLGVPYRIDFNSFIPKPS